MKKVVQVILLSKTALQTKLKLQTKQCYIYIIQPDIMQAAIAFSRVGVKLLVGLL